MVMRSLLALVAVLALALPAEAQRRGPAVKWELLGTQKVGFHVDKDVINVGRGEGRFTTLQLRVRGNDIEMIDMVVIYANGEPDRIPIKRIIRQGGSSQPIDLKGAARAIQRVELIYRSKPSFKGQATVELWGRQVAGGPPAGLPVVGAPSWAPSAKIELLGRQKVGFIKDRDIVQVGAYQGTFKRIFLRAVGNDVEMIDLVVVYANGEPDRIPVRAVIRQGQSSGPLDLKGYQRRISRIEMVYKSRPSFKGLATIEVYGVH